jgi:hypothetical protein
MELFIYLLFNSPEANCKVSIGKEANKTNKHTQIKAKQGNV